MGIKERFLGLATYLLLERPVRALSLAGFAVAFGESGKRISMHLESTTDNTANRQKLSHIIGIERWGQRRLKVALGEPSLEDEYNTYRPDPQSTWSELCVDFQTTRQTTVDLIRQLDQADVPVTTKILHNHFGPLSSRAWLRYLNLHANLESKRISGAVR